MYAIQACIDNSDRATEVIGILVEGHSADVNARDLEGWTPLHAAARFGLYERTRYCLFSAPVFLCFSARLHLHHPTHLTLVTLLVDYSSNFEVSAVYENAHYFVSVEGVEQVPYGM